MVVFPLLHLECHFIKVNFVPFFWRLVKIFIVIPWSYKNIFCRWNFGDWLEFVLIAEGLTRRKVFFVIKSISNMKNANENLWNISIFECATIWMTFILTDEKRGQAACDNRRAKPNDEAISVESCFWFVLETQSQKSLNRVFGLIRIRFVWIRKIKIHSLVKQCRKVW